MTDTTVTITFDQPEYGPADPITFTVTTNTSMTATTTVQGFVTLPGGVQLPATAQTVVHGTYGPWTVTSSAGTTYTVSQDVEDPAVWHATPNTP